ncbi:MAG TPA: response regulator [Kofleriaceae bacterium]|nr:response regulator [Kofleriaceae bacterium]
MSTPPAHDQETPETGQVVIRLEDGSAARGRVIDLSLGGALLHVPPTPVPLVDGAQVIAELVLAEGQRHAIPARLHLRAATTFVVVFTEMTADARELITSLVIGGFAEDETQRRRISRVRERRGAARCTFQPFERPRSPNCILVVDDDDDVRELMVELLEAAGYDVDAAGDGEQGLALLRANPDRYGAILLDYAMPNMDGFTFRQIQQADPVLSRIPVILSSATAPRYLPPLDVDAKLTKPLSAVTLLWTIESCMAGN